MPIYKYLLNAYELDAGTEGVETTGAGVLLEGAAAHVYPAGQLTVVVVFDEGAGGETTGVTAEPLPIQNEAWPERPLAFVNKTMTGIG
jgi:hypothetical protein